MTAIVVLWNLWQHYVRYGFDPIRMMQRREIQMQLQLPLLTRQLR